MIVKTYADLGKSGVLVNNRKALRELLRDVVNGDAEYRAILVYDVSRWGRFSNNDEAAHYEFLCSRSTYKKIKNPNSVGEHYLHVAL